MSCMSGTSPVCLVVWSFWSIWLVSYNQTNQTDQTDQMNKTSWRTISASCLKHEGRERLKASLAHNAG